MKEIQRDLSNKTIINLVGPSAVGKTTLIQEIDKNYPDFSRVISYTTRSPRDGESLDTYRFLDASAVNINELTEGSVQFDRFPGTDTVYGTEATDYRNKYNLLDTLSSSVNTFRELGFAACKQYIVIASPMEWQERINARKFNNKQLVSRYNEAINSLGWSINEQNNVKWIYNQNGALGKVAKLIVDLSVDENSYRQYQDFTAKEIGQDLLWYIKYLKRNMQEHER